MEDKSKIVVFIDDEEQPVAAFTSPVPCVIPFKYLGCATSQGGQANTIKPDDNNAKLNSAFFIVINFIY